MKDFCIGCGDLFHVDDLDEMGHCQDCDTIEQARSEEGYAQLCAFGTKFGAI